MGDKLETFCQVTLIWVGLLIFTAIFRFVIDYKDKERNITMKSFLKTYWANYKDNFWGIVFFGTITAVFAALKRN